jgi:hypothetical protein
MTENMKKEMKLGKPIADMSESELKAVQEETLKIAGENINKGGKFTKVITVDWEDYKGEIIIHRPTITEDREIGIRYARYKQDTKDVDPITDNISLYLATFDVIVDKAPDWFKPAEMYEYEFLEYIWGEYAEWRNTFRRFDKEKYRKDSTAINPAEVVVDTE